MDSPNVDPDRVLSFNEPRKVAAALRAVTDPRFADPLLSALFWRAKSLPLHVWRTAARSILDAAAEDPDRWQVPEPAQKYLGNGLWRLSTREDPPPDHWTRQSRHGLEWRSRLAIQRLAADPADGAGFLAILESGPPEQPRDAARRLAALETAIRNAATEAWLIRTARAECDEQPPTCPTCGGPLPWNRRAHQCHKDAIERAAKLRALRWKLIETASLTPDEAAERLAFDRRELTYLLDRARSFVNPRSGDACPLCGLPVVHKRATKTRPEGIFDHYKRRNPYTFEWDAPEQGPHECHTHLLATIERLETLTQKESEVHV